MGPAEHDGDLRAQHAEGLTRRHPSRDRRTLPPLTLIAEDGAN
jgi:hypothetical protein